MGIALDDLTSVPAPYLRTARSVPSKIGDRGQYPWNLEFVHGLDLDFTSAVTFFVGENGSGKSTLLQALVKLEGLPVGGGGKNELADSHAPTDDAPLADALERAYSKRPRSAFFFRAEYFAHFASMLEAR